MSDSGLLGQHSEHTYPEISLHLLKLTCGGQRGIPKPSERYISPLCLTSVPGPPSEEFFQSGGWTTSAASFKCGEFAALLLVPWEQPRNLPPAWGRAQPPFRGSSVLFYQQANFFSHCPELKAVSNIDWMKLCLHAQLDLHHSRSTQLCDGEPDYIQPGSLSITHQYRLLPHQRGDSPCYYSQICQLGIGPFQLTGPPPWPQSTKTE